MPSRFVRALSGLDLEERILNSAALFGAASVFLPWISGEFLGDDAVSYSGLQFFTSVIGIAILVLHGGVLALTVLPMAGVTIRLRKRHREIVRLCLTSQATILSLAALSVLTKVTYDYTRMEIRFGIYFTFIGSLIAAFYSFWRLQEHLRTGVQEVFHHPDDHLEPGERPDSALQPPPPPPPPPPLEPEEHHIRP